MRVSSIELRNLAIGSLEPGRVEYGDPRTSAWSLAEVENPRPHPGAAQPSTCLTASPKSFGGLLQLGKC